MNEVKFFFRKPQKGFNSIENLFNAVIPNIYSFYSVNKIYAPEKKVSLFKIFRNLTWAKKNNSFINHITGDINYIALVLPSKNTILTIHDIESVLQIENKFKRLIISFFWLYLPLKKLKYITAISNTTKQKLVEHFSVPPHKIRVIPNCYSLDFIEDKKEFNKVQPNILIIGTKKNKNLERLIYAVKNISCQLLIVGKLSNNQINLLKENNIKYLNYFQISQEEMIKVYRQSDILYFASLYEGFGIPILEAQATGRVVITSNCSSMPEVAGEGAYFVDPNNIEEIKIAIKELSLNDSLRNKLINIGFENCKLYKPEIIAQKYCDLYQEVINNKRH